MRNLVVDIGNSRIKAAFFKDDKLVLEASLEEIGDLLDFAKNQGFDHCLVCSVFQSETELSQMLDFPFMYLDKKTLMPFQNLYATPDTLGVDRKAAVVGARDKFPQGPLLAIDMGTCITYDILDDQDRYFGGAISPGLNMRFKAMHEQTARLPMAHLEKGEMIDLIANSTQTGIQSGVYNGIKFELEGFIQSLSKSYQELKVIICGGDSKFFESLTKGHIFVIPNLVLFGLNRILTYNVNKK